MSWLKGTLASVTLHSIRQELFNPKLFQAIRLGWTLPPIHSWCREAQINLAKGMGII